MHELFFCPNKTRGEILTDPEIRFSNTPHFRSNSLSLRVPVSHYRERVDR